MKKLDLFKSSVVIAFSLWSFNSFSQTSLYFTEQTSGYPSDYTFSTGDVIYFSKGLNTNSGKTCEGSDGFLRDYRIQDSYFILQLVSTSLDSISLYGVGSSDKARNFSKIEIATESKDGPWTDITNSVNVGNPMQYNSCGRNLTAWGINASKGSFVRFSITLTSDNTTLAPTNISELLLFPVKAGPSTIVDDIHANKNIKGKKYYSLMGVEVDETTTGFVIEKVIYEDGTSMQVKVFKALR